jgi:hypothetical protein
MNNSMTQAADDREKYKWAWPVFDTAIASPRQPGLFGDIRE